MRTAELADYLLNYWVAKANGYVLTHDIGDNYSWVAPGNKWIAFKHTYSPSTNWSHGGPIIEREHIQSRFVQSGRFIGDKFENKWLCSYPGGVSEIGDTLLIAAMRTYIASRFGDVVDDRQAHHV